MTSIMRKRWLVVATAAVLVALVVVTMQAAFASDGDGTYVTTAGNTDGDWPWLSAYGTSPAGDPADSYHSAVNHWNPASTGSISMAVTDGIDETMGFNMTAWTAAANVVSGSGSSWTWPSNNPTHAPAAYPDFFQGCHWGQCTWDGSDYGNGNAGIPYPIQAGTIANLDSTFNIGVTGQAAGSGAVWDAAFDIWLDTGTRTIQSGWWHTTNWSTNPTTQTEVYSDYVGWPVMPGFPGALLKYVNEDASANPYFRQIGQDDGAEVMIWMNNRGYGADTDHNPDTEQGNPITPAGQQIAWGVTIPGTPDGSTWDVWAGRLQADPQAGDPADVLDHFPSWNVISYVKVNSDGSNPDTKAMTFDANQFIQDATTRDCPAVKNGPVVAGNKCAFSSWWLTSVQSGFEIWANGEGLSVDQFSVKPNTNVQVDTGLTHDNGDGTTTTRIHWSQKFVLRYKENCGATSVTATIADNAGHSHDYTLTPASNKVVTGLDGINNTMWAVRAGPLFQYGLHNDDSQPGGSSVTFTPNGGTCTGSTIAPVYIDPSGVVVNTLGQPVEGADVTLEYAPGIASSDPEPAASTFIPAPTGNGIMIPDQNPLVTDANGYYRWDVVDGWYKTQASKSGCPSAESPALPVSEGNPATNVNLVLDCGEGTGDDDLLVQVTPQNDWGTGYCSNVTITNNSDEAIDWQVTLDVEGAIYDFWNVVWSQSGNTVTAEGVDWNNILQPGESTHSIGFCANRDDSGGGSGNVDVTVTTQSDWNTGYCANVTVINNTSAPVDWQVTFPVVGTVNNFWNVIWSQSGNQVTAGGVGWNNILQPGESSHSIGFCAAK